MNIKIIAVSVLIATLFVSAIAGTIFYYNSVVNDRNSKIASLNNQVKNLTSEVQNFTAQVGYLLNMTRSNENLICTNAVVGSGYNRVSWNWTVTLGLENTGNATAIINDIVINGQSYSSFSPVPIVTPSIKNGYALLPNQSVTITIQETNSTSTPFQGSAEIYVLTAIGNSLSIPIAPA